MAEAQGVAGRTHAIAAVRNPDTGATRLMVHSCGGGLPVTGEKCPDCGMPILLSAEGGGRSEE